jgi:hypothetical protein
MKHESKFNSDQQQEHQSHSSQEQAQQNGNLEFATMEEMFRHDALHNPVPPAVEVRLQKSIEALPPAPSMPWWKKILGS